MQLSIQQVVLQSLPSLLKFEKKKAGVGEEKPCDGFSMGRVKGHLQLQRERNQAHFWEGWR